MKTKNFFKVTTLFVVTLITTLLFQSCDKSKQLTPQELEGYWILKTLNGQDAKSVFLGAIPTLEFNFQDSTIYGTGGCNRYNGKFSYKEGIFAAPNLATTMMLCTEDNAEPEFLLALSDGDNILSLVNGVLTITNGGKVTLEFEKGTPQAEAQPVKVSAETLNGIWTLKNIDGAEATSKFENSIPSLAFDFENNRVSGNAGCNNYNATFTLADNQLVVGPIMSTKMACPSLEGETTFTQAIADSSLLSLPNENVLQVTKNGTVLLEFEKSAGK